MSSALSAVPRPLPSDSPAAPADLLDTVARVARTGGWHLDVSQERLWWSPQVAALFGWEHGSHPLEEALARFAPEARALVRNTLREAARLGTSLNLLCKALLPCGTPVSVRFTGQPVHDETGQITAVYGALRDMRESDERFLLVARATTDAIWDWNLLDDTMWWNEGMQTLFGVPLNSLPPDSTSWTERVHPEDAERVIGGLQQMLRGTAEHWSDEYRFRRQDGSYAWVRDRGFVLRDAQGRGWRMVGGMTDIGARKQVELQQQQEAHAHARLLHMQRQITRLEQPLDQVLQEAARTACDLAGAESAAIALREGNWLRVHAQAGPQPAPPTPAALSKHSVWQQLSAPATPGEATADHVECMQEGRRTLAVPLRGPSALTGLLQVVAAPGQGFSLRHLAHLRILTESLGALVQLRHVNAQLRASEQQYRALFADHPQPMWVCERGSLRLLAANRAMARHYGYAEDELGSLDLLSFWHAPGREQAAAVLQDAAASSGPVLAQHIRKDGTPLEMELYVGNATFGGRDAWQVLANDVTERRRIERELAHLNRTQRMRSACSETLVRATSEAALLHAVCRVAVEIGGYSMCWVGMARDDDRRSIEPVAHAGGDGDYIRDLHRLSWSANDPHGKGPAGVTVRTGQTVIVRDIRTNPSFSSLAGQMTRRGYHAVVCLPLRTAQRTFGLLQLYAPEVLHVGEEETQLLEAMATDLAFGIGNLRARAEQQRLQAALLKVATAVSEGIGTAFFERLAHNMAEALHAQIACVARLLPPVEGAPPRAVTLSYVAQGVVQPNAEYSLEGTPSRQLLTQRQFVITDHAATLYPRAPVLQRAGARSYVGQQLVASDGTPMGLIFVMYAQPLEQADFALNTLRIFAARASAELERQTADQRIRHQASLLDKARDAIIVRDLNHRITFWNEGAERMYGWTREEALGRSIASLLYKDTRDFERATAAVLQQGDWSGEIVQHGRDGRALEVEGRWTLVRNERGEPESVLAINADIGQRKENEREIQRLAYYDPLTGLPNRIRLLERIGQALQQAQQHRRGGALLFIDLDNFKTLNDTLGHDKGDQLLQLVAQRLSTCVRFVDTVARLGGDEFVVMIEELSQEAEALAEQARVVGEKVLTVLSAPYTLAGYQYRSTPSIGIALFNDAPTTIGELLQQADLAMYQAKTAGRSTLRFFNPSMQLAVAERASLEADLRNALSQDELLLHYQPQFTAEGRIVGVEALLRWAHPERGMVPPAQFIPLAEETGLVLPLGHWVLHTACSLLATWQRDPARAHLTMAVNVSSRQFRNEGFVDDLARILAVTGAPPSQLKLEITESLLVEDMEETIATMEALRRHGVGFSLDDFGTGYSSLAYLKRMPLEQLKVDQSFVRDLLTDPNDAAIVRTIIALAASLGLEAIAEGVETLEQRDWLAQAGCQCYQGYFFSRPLPIAPLEELLHTHCQA